MTRDKQDTQVSVRLSSQLKDRVDMYAQMIGRSKSHVTIEALGDYLAWRIPQIEDLRLAIAAADQGDFADETEVNAVFKKHGGSVKRSGKATAKPSAPRQK